MVSELHQGVQDNSYIQLTPNRAGGDPLTERLSWPTYARAEVRPPHPHSKNDNFLAEFDEVSTTGTPTTRSRY